MVTIVTIRDKKDSIRDLLFFYSTTITGWGVYINSAQESMSELLKNIVLVHVSGRITMIDCLTF